MTPESIQALIILAIIAGTYVTISVAWVFYITAMQLIPLVKENRAGTLYISTFGKIFIYPAIITAFILDATANLLFSLILLDIPQEPLLTGKLKRLKADGGWRGEAAAFLCREMLNPFDPSGDHC